MSQPKKTLVDVQAAFESRRILRCSRSELEHLLVAAGSESIAEPLKRAHAHEMSETIRRLLAARARPRHSRLALVAAVLALAALLISVTQVFYSQRAQTFAAETAAEMSDLLRATNRDRWLGDPRVQLTLEEIAHRAPSLGTGTLQAWWAGEQARQVQSLEALAKKQTLAGDREGAAQSAKRADVIRTSIDSLASYEKPQG